MAPEPSSPRPPRRGRDWQPPEDPLRGRATFYAVGIVATLSYVALRFGPSLVGLGGGVEELLAAVAPLPIAVTTLLVVVQRVRSGPRWRVRAYLWGVATPPVVLVLLKVLSLLSGLAR